MALSEMISNEFGAPGSMIISMRTGETLHAISVRHGARVEARGGDVRFVFPDGSVIITDGRVWDYGYESCWCWDSAGHADTCQASWDSSRKVRTSDRHKSNEPYLFPVKHWCTPIGGKYAAIFVLELSDAKCQDCQRHIIWGLRLGSLEDDSGRHIVIGTCACEKRIWRAKRDAHASDTNIRYRELSQKIKGVFLTSDHLVSHFGALQSMLDVTVEELNASKDG